MESVDYWPMVRPILKTLGGNPKLVSVSMTWLVDGILLLRGVCHTLGRAMHWTNVWRTALWGTQWGQMDGLMTPWASLRCLSTSGINRLSVNCSAGLNCLVCQWLYCPWRKIVTWLILPVVICLSQRLSHACLSISNLYGETANGSLNQLSFIW